MFGIGSGHGDERGVVGYIAVLSLALDDSFGDISQASLF